MTRGFETTIVAVTAVMVLTACAVGATGETHDSNRYKVIVDHAPFCASAGVASAAAQPNFATRYAFVGVVSTTEDNRPLAIIQDKEQNNRIHFKAEGETIDTVKVMKIEQSPAKLVLQQGLEVATLSFQEARGGMPPALAPGMARQAPGMAPPATGTPAPGALVRTQPTPRRIPFRRGGTE